MANRQTSFVRHAAAVGRAAARHVVLEAITANRILRGLDRQYDNHPKVHILLLHGVTKQEIAPFHRLISHLQHHYTFIDYSDAVTRIMTGNIERPYLSFSFDDGLRSCLTAAYVLEEFGTRGCFFVCPSVLSADRTTRQRFCRERLWIRPTRLLNWPDVINLRDRGHEIGSHTWDHSNMTSLNRWQLMEQLVLSKTALERQLGDTPHFAWPYGRFHSFTPEAAQAVQAAGYLSCASGERGCHAASTGDMTHRPCIRRDSIEARWPWRHICYFLQRSAQSPLDAKSTWPAAWNPTDAPVTYPEWRRQDAA